jgi:hypothetical protein
MTTPAQQAALEKAVVPVAYFAMFDFATAAVRVSNFNQSVDWGGYTWTGLGALGNISEVEESDGVESKSLNFTLNVAQKSLLSLAVGPVEEYRGRDARLYMCPLTENLQLIDTPVLCWRGIMDMMSVGIEGEEGQIILKCETSAHGLKRQPALRMNAVQQRAKYPTDTGFDYLNSLIAEPQLWLSRRFQSI